MRATTCSQITAPSGSPGTARSAAVAWSDSVVSIACSVTPPSCSIPEFEEPVEDAVDGLAGHVRLDDVAFGLHGGALLPAAVGHGVGADRPGGRVFGVGNREVGGRAGVILEGESGANDPVGIALLLALLATLITRPADAQEDGRE